MTTCSCMLPLLVFPEGQHLELMQNDYVLATVLFLDDGQVDQLSIFSVVRLFRIRHIKLPANYRFLAQKNV
ncbi:MAG: hypothetical protein CW691_06110 [Candidatus Bathyarchaeum sp.]|nr:MAG: hypothetical protein CW691_06110 [Candidatus Bathyarchaeum sp.]